MQAIVSSGAAARSRRCSERTVVRADIGRILLILVLVQQRVVGLPGGRHGDASCSAATLGDPYGSCVVEEKFKSRGDFSGAAHNENSGRSLLSHGWRNPLKPTVGLSRCYTTASR
jgi:hypothetical protein